MKTIMDQIEQSVVYSHHQERKKEKKEPFDSVEWSPIFAFCKKKVVEKKQENVDQRPNHNSQMRIKLSSYHCRAAEKIILTKIWRRMTFAKDTSILNVCQPHLIPLEPLPKLIQSPLVQFLL